MRGVMKLLIGHVVATLIHAVLVVSTANAVGSRDGWGYSSRLEIVLVVPRELFTTYYILQFALVVVIVDNIDSTE